jgi:hypothetical protein
MLTIEQIKDIDVDLDVAREALNQSEKRLDDAFEAKKAVEQKATVLFGTYVTISLALFGFAATLVNANLLHIKLWPFFVTGTFFILGAACFAGVFRAAEYGNKGSEPSMWLRSGLIDGDKMGLARMLAYLAHHHSRRIEVSYQSNATKSRFLHSGMIFGVMGSAVFLILLISVASTIRP